MSYSEWRGWENATATRIAMQDGIRYFRFDISPNATEEAFVENMSDEGARFIGILDYNTVGAEIRGGRCIANCNWTLADWNESVSLAVSDYPDVHVWEIWNEPQIAMFQDGVQNGSAYNYYLMLKSAHGIIKAHNNSDTVLCLGGDNIYSGGASFDQNDYLWAQQVWSYGASDYCDAISLHAYSGFIYLMNQTPYGSFSTMGGIFNQSLESYEKLTGKPIWITEFGIPSNNGTGLGGELGNSQYKQAEFLNQTFNLFLSKPYVAGISWFNLAGLADAPYNFDFGLLNASTLAAKPAMYAYAKELRMQQ